MSYPALPLTKIQRCLAVTTLLLAAGGHANAQQNGTVPPVVVSGAEDGGGSAQDGLTGPVRRVRTEVANLLFKDGKLVEGPRALMETTVYDRQGRKVDHSIYAVSGGQPGGKEVYKHDARGNVVEMTVLDDAGSVISQEVYAYEFDALGNWTKMTTSVAVVENNNVTYEPTEVTYRAITYYRTDAVAKAVLAPAPISDESGRASAAPPARKDEAAETGEPKQLTVPAAGEASQPVTAQRIASDPSAVSPAGGEATHPSTGTASKSGEVGDEIGAEKTADSVPTKIEHAVAEQPPAEQPAPRRPENAVSGGVLNGRAIDLPLPVYPESARRLGYEGKVSVKVIIDPTGKVTSADAVSGPHQLRGAAVYAARRARFSPTLLSGRPTEVTGFINYHFTLKQ